MDLPHPSGKGVGHDSGNDDSKSDEEGELEDGDTDFKRNRVGVGEDLLLWPNHW